MPQATAEPVIKAYWQPGCTSCLRMKEFLTKHGVPFVSINVLEDEGAFAELAALGVRSVPVVRRGQDWANGQVLREVARRLEKCLRPGDTVGRLAGDEFAILLERIEGIDEATGVGQRIQDELSAPIDIQGRPVYPWASMGIALGVNSYEKPDEILRDADAAMYRAKALGRARYQVFEVGMGKA